MQKNRTIKRLVLIRDKAAQKTNLRVKEREKKVSTKESVLIYIDKGHS